MRRLRRVQLQHLEYKAIGKLEPWSWVLTVVAIYHLTPLDRPVEVLKKIDSLRRAYFGLALTWRRQQVQNQLGVSMHA